jgi:hypothetical protein
MTVRRRRGREGWGRWSALAGLVLLVSCTAPEPSGSESEGVGGDSWEGGGEAGPGGESETGGPGPSFEDPQTCDASDDCRRGVCVAAWDAALGAPLLPFVCVEDCVESEDAVRACADDAACCQGTCSVTGRCVG